MRPIILLMLGVQIAIFLVTAATVLFGRSSANKPRPGWSSLGTSLFVVALASCMIAGDHRGDTGVEALMFGATLLLGMSIFSILAAIRQRRGLDGGTDEMSPAG
jgi:hypothetical protein